MAGSALLANFHFQSSKESQGIAPTIAFSIMAAATVILVLRGLWSCIDAIAARKTTRMFHQEEIPSRFLFNWGDTLTAVDGHSSFTRKLAALSPEEILKHASAELWTDILQHSQRHRHLRSAITIFRYTVISFFILAVVTFVSAGK
ncbi:hypothetical protein [Kitasatospora griseola]|uniref:hypothetical protein n=1 Tax=Kitasatospora griseola TaxID=2064 RepID=UPI001671859D|nr:hypothetical protein [Kitasatospora griseola]